MESFSLYNLQGFLFFAHYVQYILIWPMLTTSGASGGNRTNGSPSGGILTEGGGTCHFFEHYPNIKTSGCDHVPDPFFFVASDVVNVIYTVCQERRGKHGCDHKAISLLWSVKGRNMGNHLCTTPRQGLVRMAKLQTLLFLFWGGDMQCRHWSLEVWSMWNILCTMSCKLCTPYLDMNTTQIW